MSFFDTYDSIESSEFERRDQISFGNRFRRKRTKRDWKKNDTKITPEKESSSIKKNTISNDSIKAT